MAKQVSDPLLDVSTFGNEIVLSPQPQSQPQIPALAPLKSVEPLSPKAPTIPPKIKKKNIRSYLLTELALLDDYWGDAFDQYNAFGDGNDMDVDEQESSIWDFLNQLEGQINALYQLGRYFGINQQAMLAVIPRLSENQGWNDASMTMASELVADMK